MGRGRVMQSFEDGEQQVTGDVVADGEPAED